MDLSTLPHLPQAELLNNEFKLTYSTQKAAYWEQTINELLITIKTTNLSEIYTKELRCSFTISMDPVSSEYADRMINARDRYFIRTRNNTLDILMAPFNNLPLFINNEEPFGELACWRLQLPKPEPNRFYPIFNIEYLQTPVSNKNYNFGV